MERMKNDHSFPLPFGATEGIACSGKAMMYRMEKAEVSDWEKYLETLSQAGYRNLWYRKSGNDLFSAFSDGSCKLSVSFWKREHILRIIVESLPILPKFSEQRKILFPCVTFTQFCTHTSCSQKIRGSASGMGYVFRLTDGRLIVIDGGFHLAPDFGDDYPDFVRLLRDLSGGEKPQIALWILTHPHIDHYGLLKQFQPEDADIFAYMATLPPAGISDGACEDMLQHIPDFTEKNICAHTGDWYSFGDAELEIYYTCEELMLSDAEFLRRDANNLSLIFGIRVGGQQVMFTGDARYPALDRAMLLCGERLKSDICQIPHHGRTVFGDDRFLSFVSPEVALWPACRTQIDYDTAHVEGVNEWIFSSQSTVTDHFVANDGTVTLDLPYVPEGIPYQKGEG